MAGEARWPPRLPNRPTSADQPGNQAQLLPKIGAATLDHAEKLFAEINAFVRQS